MSIVNSNNFLHKTVDGVKQFFSPLVNAATVVLKDGTRLEKDGKIHADTTDASKKLNGKEPKYYIQPRNLLDNSDFRNPVNQRRQTSYAGATYTIDRWFLSTDSVGGTVSIDDSGLTLDRNTINGYTFLQYIEKLDTSKVYTFAVKDVVGNVYLIHSVPNERNEETTPFGTIIAKTKTDAFPAFGVTLNDETSITLEWAAVYEGEYTADNLPPYVPKGYGVELAECQRYYYKLDSGNYLLFRIRNMHEINGYGAFEICPPIIFPQTMREKPTVEISYDINDGENAIGTPFDWNDKYCIMPNVNVPAGSWFDCNYVIASADL